MTTAYERAHAARREAYRLGAVTLYAESGPLILKMRGEGMRFHDIGEVLDAAGILPPGGGRWWPATVRYVFLKLTRHEKEIQASTKSTMG